MYDEENHTTKANEENGCEGLEGEIERTGEEFSL